jgi:hypothetical protein
MFSSENRGKEREFREKESPITITEKKTQTHVDFRFDVRVLSGV